MVYTEHTRKPCILPGSGCFQPLFYLTGKTPDGWLASRLARGGKGIDFLLTYCYLLDPITLRIRPMDKVTWTS